MTKKYARLISLTVILAVVCSIFAACGDGSPSSTAPAQSESPASSASPSEAGTDAGAEGEGIGDRVEFLLSYPQEKKTLYRILDDFEEHYGTELVIQLIPNSSELMKQLNIMVAGSNLPDVVDMDAPYHGAYVKMGVFADITDRVTAELDVSQYFQGTLDAVLFDGRYFGMPFTSNCVALYYNVDMFEEAGLSEPPKTWTEVADYAQQLTKDGVYGYTTIAYLDMNGTFRYFPVLWSNGGDIDDLGGQGNIDTLQFYLDLIDSKSMNPEVANWSPDDGVNQFLNGNTAMLLCGSWQLPKIQNAEFNWSVADIPAGTQRQATCLGGHSLGVVAGQNEDGGWALAKWFQEPDNMFDFSYDEGYLPARQDVAARSEFQEGALGLFMMNMEHALPRGPLANWTEVDAVCQEMLQSVVIRAKTPEQAAAEAAEAMAPLLQD